MIKKGTEILFKIDENDIKAAIKMAKEHVFIDNLRDRKSFVQFDSKIRGYLGEITFVRWLRDNLVDIVNVDDTDTNNNIDMDVVVKNEYTDKIIIEIKTSLVPDNWKAGIDDIINNGDIKIIKRENRFELTTVDFYVQIYFRQFSKRRDDSLKTIQGEINDYTNDELIDLMGLKKLDHIFIAWMDKPSLTEYLNTQENKTWSYAMRVFWKCPIKECKMSKDIIESLKSYGR